MPNATRVQLSIRCGFESEPIQLGEVDTVSMPSVLFAIRFDGEVQPIVVKAITIMPVSQKRPHTDICYIALIDNGDLSGVLQDEICRLA